MQVVESYGLAIRHICQRMMTLEEAQKLYPWVLTGEELPQGYSQDRRITAVVIDNVFMARPQRGLAEADILFECLVEGGITRFMALYADYRSLPQVGPVRSSRPWQGRSAPCCWKSVPGVIWQPAPGGGPASFAARLSVCRGFRSCSKSGPSARRK